MAAVACIRVAAFLCVALLCLPSALAAELKCLEDLHFLVHGQLWTWQQIGGDMSFGPLNDTLHPASLDHYISVTAMNTGLERCGAIPVGNITFQLRPASSDAEVWVNIWLWHEFYFLDSIVSAGGPVKRVVDLGGNCGMAALYFATHWADSEVLVVEPSLDNFGAITINAAGHHNMFLERAAIAAADGFSLFLDHGLGHWGYRTSTLQGHMHRHGSEQGYHRRIIPSLSIDSLLHKYNWESVDFMKIDIEGGELALCRQLKQGGARWPGVVRCLTMEFHDRFGGEHANVSTFCREALTASGFKPKGTFGELEMFCH